MCACVHAGIYSCAPAEAREGTGSLGAGITGDLQNTSAGIQTLVPAMNTRHCNY